MTVGAVVAPGDVVGVGGAVVAAGPVVAVGWVVGAASSPQATATVSRTAMGRASTQPALIHLALDTVCLLVGVLASIEEGTFLRLPVF